MALPHQLRAIIDLARVVIDKRFVWQISCRVWMRWRSRWSADTALAPFSSINIRGQVSLILHTDIKVQIAV